MEAAGGKIPSFISKIIEMYRSCPMNYGARSRPFGPLYKEVANIDLLGVKKKKFVKGKSHSPLLRLCTSFFSSFVPA